MHIAIRSDLDQRDRKPSKLTEMRESWLGNEDP